MPRRRGTGRSAARGGNSGKTRTTARQETSSATSRSRSSSSSTTSSRPTSTRPIEKANNPTEEQAKEANNPVIVADPVEQRWEEDAGMYTHKKFKKMASSVVVTSVATPPAEQPPLSSSVSSHFSIQQSLPLKHSALSLIETQQQQLRTVHHYQQQPVSHHPSQRVHVPPPSPSRLVIDEHGSEQPHRKNVCPYCNNSFAKPSVLEKHIRTHTNERPYPCNPCQIAFKTQSNLYKHSRSKSHELKVHQGIDSSYAEKVAELGDSFKEELDKPNSVPPPPSPMAPPMDQPRTIMINEQQQPRDFRMKATTVAIIPQQNQNHRIVNSRIPPVAHLEPPRPVADSIPQHIDKIISHNQTIVETLDPLWTKKFMRQQLKEDQQQQPSVVTLEKASPPRKFVTTNSGQVTMSLVNSKPTHQATVNLVQPGSVQVHHQSTSASSSPLSIHLARSQPPPPSHHAHPTLTVVPSGLRLNEQTPFMVVKQTEEAKKAEEMLNAKSVKEVWLNSHNRPSPVVQQPQHLNHHLHHHPNSLEGSMIKELLIKTRGATTLEPAGPIEQNRRDSASSNGSGGSQIVLQVTKAPFEPQMKLLPNVSLILTPTTSTLTASNLTVTSLPMSKSRILPQGLISQAPGISTSTPIYASEVLKCNMCQKSFSGIDLELHQREYCPARIVPSQQQNHIHHHQQQQQPSVIAQLREARLPEKHFRPSQELSHEDESPSKKPRLTILPHNQHIPVKTLLNSGGGIVTVSKAPIQPVHHGGLLQIAKPILQSGGRVQVTNKSIPGIPVPSMAGLLTGIKNVPSQALFSLPGKRTEIVPGMPGPSKEHVSTIPSSNQNEAVKMDVVKIESDSSKAEGGFLRPNSLPLTPGSFKPKKHVMIIGGDTLVSPETPRPRKSYMLQYQNGTAYTTLGFKSSTKVYYTTIFHQQPMYVANKPRISMYSNWRVVSKDSHPSNLTPGQSLNAYNSSLHLSSHGLFTSSGYTRKDINDSMIVSHSSKWKALKDVKPSKPEDQKEKDGSNLPANSSASPSSNSNVVRTVEGGYKSLDDDYTYVRGRGRGRYVCNSCGIRCKKPSMLKKHIRTHSNFRPYTCKYCNFAFKTKGNLTKHMKSKTHHKKCVELGISPVPTSVPDDYNSATDEPGVPGPSNSQLQPGDSDSEDLDSDGEEDNEQFEDAEDEVEIIGEDNSMVAKGLLPFKPKLSLYPYNAAKKEVTEATSTDTASTSVTTTATDSFQAPVIGEKYYFSKTPIPNEIAKQAAATVMALASSALKSVTTTSNTVTTITIPGLAPSNTMTTMSLPSIAQTNTMTTLTPGLIPSNTMTTFSLPSVAQSNTMTTLSPMILPSLAPTNTVTTITLPSVRPSLTTASSTNITSSAVTVLQPIVTSTAEESVTVMKVVPHELPEPTHRIGSLTIEKAPRNVNVLELSTSVAQQQPQQQSQPIVRKPVQLPHDVQLLAVQQNQEQPKRSPNKSLANTRAGSATAESYAESLVISPPNKNASEANKADVEAKSEQAANASNQNSNSNQASGSGKFVCEICQKAFPHHQQLFLHKKVHIFERPYRCDPCGISFRTFGTLQKHKRSTSHFNKVNINATFGEPSSSNPRPFLCSDCNTGFRIHGHLAKHLRSKSHIMKLENLGKLPIGLFAEMERIGTNFNEIDTQDCDSSLDSLKKMAAKLWKNKEISVDASNTNGLLSPHHTPEISIKEEPMDTTSTSSGRRSLEPEIQNYRKSPEFQQSATIIQRSSIPSTMNPPNGNTALNLSMPTNLVLHENKNHHDIRRASFSSSGHEDGGPPSTDNSDMENGLKHDSRYHKKFFTSVEHHHEPSPQVVAQTQPPPQPSPVTQPPPPAPPQQQQRILVPQVPQPTPLYGRPLHLSRGYPVVYSNGLISNMSREGSLSSDSGDGSGPISPVVNMKCEICGLSFGNSKSLQQHVLSHAQARPFVCHRCDAGFMAQHQLDAHMKLH